MRHFSKHRGIGHASRLALAAALALPASVALPGAAHAQATRQSFNIPAGDLAAGLQAFSAQTGMQLVYPSELVAGKRTSGISGEMSAQDGLGRLLAGTGLSARLSGNSATLIAVGPTGDVAAAEGERLLGPVRVEGSQGSAYSAPVRGDGVAQLGGVRGRQDLESDGFRANISSVSTGAPVALEDVPRSITVQTQELIEKQDITDIGEALNRMPGVTVQGEGLRPIYYSRGYEITAFSVDGGPVQNLRDYTNAAISLDAYERVELLRGPNAVFTGPGSVGGTINLVRKRPLASEALTVKAEFGNQARLGLVTDYSTPSFLGSPVAFRAIASVRRDGGVVDNYDVTRYLLTGLFDIPLGDKARVEAGWEFSKLKSNGAYLGHGRFFDGSPISVPRRFNAMPTTAFERDEKLEVFTKLFVDIAEDWDVEIGTTYTDRTTHTTSNYQSANIFPDGTVLFGPGVVSTASLSPRSPTAIDVQARLTGRFETFGLVHNVFASANYRQNDEGPLARNEPGYTFALINSLDDYFNLQFETDDSVPANYLGYSGSQNTLATITLGDTISWRDHIFLTATFSKSVGQNNSFDFSDYGFGFGNLGNNTNPSPASWRPSFSASIKPTKNLTLFGSYSDGYNPNFGAFTISGEAPNYIFAEARPTTWENTEVGAKYATSQWIASLSAYRLNQTGLIEYANISICPPRRGPNGEFVAPCYLSGDISARSQGIDFEFSGAIVPGLNVAASASYVSLKKTGELANGEERNFLTRSPQTSANMTLDWQPGFMPISLQVFGRYRGKYHESGNGIVRDANGNFAQQRYVVEQSPFFLLDLGAEYRLTDNVSVKLLIENIFDKKYLSASSIGIGGNYFGRPRSVMASLTWMRGSGANGTSPTTGLTPFGDPADWYAAFDTGYAFVGDIKAGATGKAIDETTPVKWTLHTRNKPAFAARIGKYLGPNFRAEIDMQYRSAGFGRIGGSDVAPFGLCGSLNAGENNSPFDCERVPGGVKSWALMANGIFELGSKGAPVRPFFGGGIGFSRDTMLFRGKLDGVGLDTPFGNSGTQRERLESLLSQDRMGSFVAQAMAGASLRLGDRLRIDGTYRLVHMPKLRWSSYNVPDLTPTLGDFDASYSAHMLTVGLRWAFGSSTN